MWGELGLAMVCIFARRSLTKIPTVRPNEACYNQKGTIKYLPDPNLARNPAVLSQYLEVAVCPDSVQGFWFAICEIGTVNLPKLYISLCCPELMSVQLPLTHVLTLSFHTSLS